jgi:Xaa-Pro aminopeptidase
MNAISSLTRKKLASISKARMRREGIDAWIVFTREGSVDPLANEFGLESCTWRSSGILTRDNETIAVVGNFDVKQVEKSEIYDQVLGYGSEGATEFLNSISRKKSLKKIAVNISDDFGLADGLSISMKRYLSQSIPNARLVSSEDLAIDLRARLLPEEMRKMRKAVKVTEEILDEAESHVIKVGKKDKDVFDYLQKEVAARNASFAWDKSMNPGLNVGTAEPQHSGYDNVSLGKRKLFKIDFGIKLDGYCSDLQRVYYFGSPPEKLKVDFKVARNANDVAITKISPRSKGYEVDKSGRDYLVRRGFADFKHALGHTIARTAHEIGPLLGPRWRNRYGHAMDKEIGTSIAFTIEPTVYSKFGGINLEQDVLVHDDGHVERLSVPQEEIIAL